MDFTATVSVSQKAFSLSGELCPQQMPKQSVFGELKYSKDSTSCSSVQIGRNWSLSYEWTDLPPYCSTKARVHWLSDSDKQVYRFPLQANHLCPCWFTVIWNQFDICKVCPERQITTQHYYVIVPLFCWHCKSIADSKIDTEKSLYSKISDLVVRALNNYVLCLLWLT